MRTSTIPLTEWLQRLRVFTAGLAVATAAAAVPADAQPLDKTRPALPAAARPGACTSGVAEAVLDAGDVRATLFNTGSLFFGNQTTDGSGYVAPAASGRSPLFAAGLWVGGRVGGEIRTAAARYSTYEFWPGPLGPAAAPPAECAPFDRIYTVSVSDLALYAADPSSAPADLRAWPVGLGAPTVDAGGVPVVTADRSRVINLAAGERPALYGGQTAFWVMNDAAGPHNSTGSPAPLGIEVQVAAFAVPSAVAALDQTTVYRYRIVNRGTSAITDAHAAIFADPDIGNFDDDYVGSDPARGMAVAYNADDFDEDGSSALGGYGPNPPAVGFDLLTGAASVTYFINGQAGGPQNDPNTAAGYYNFMRGVWGDGTPMTAAGDGYGDGGPVTPYAFPGDPVTGAAWSERNTDGAGATNPPGDRRFVVSSPAFALAAGATRELYVAIIYGRGQTHLDAVTQVRAASDAVQARFDSGALGGQLPLPAVVAPPAATGPADGAAFTDLDPPVLMWAASAPRGTAAHGGSLRHRVEIAYSPDFYPGETNTFTVEATQFTVPTYLLGANALETRHWRVRVDDPLAAVSRPSASRTFRGARLEPEFAGAGAGIVEVAYPGVPDVCAGTPADPGCQSFGGNTVWEDASATGDYAVANVPSGLASLSAFVGALGEDDLEIRFTTGGGYALYLAAPVNRIVRVPFEVWNVGDTADPGDDLRMIPNLTPADGGRTDWANAFPIPNAFNGRPGTERVNAYMPDRPDGYARFEAAAVTFGGAGATYNPAADGDTQVDTAPATGEPCPNQGRYTDYCYRNNLVSGTTTVQLLRRVVFVDLAGDGTTPPAGTVVRFTTTNRVVGAESAAGGATVVLARAVPNPSAMATTLAYTVATAGPARLVVYDVLGRAVAVLVDGEVGAGARTARLDTSRLAAGVYVAVLVAGGTRSSQRLTVAR